MTGEEFRELVESHDELIFVCQAAFETIMSAANTEISSRQLKKKILKDFQRALLARNVTEGFSLRAEAIREKISKEYRLSLAYDTGVQIPVGDVSVN